MSMVCVEITPEAGIECLLQEDLGTFSSPDLLEQSECRECKCKVSPTLWVKKMTPVTQHLPATCLALFLVGWGRAGPDALGPLAGPALRSSWQAWGVVSAHGTFSKPIPS